MDVKLVVSSYSDLSKLSSNIVCVHFRKFVSKRLLDKVLKSCPKLKKISLSMYAARRLDCFSSYLSGKGLLIEFSKRGSGRPNSIEIKRRWIK